MKKLMSTLVVLSALSATITPIIAETPKSIRKNEAITETVQPWILARNIHKTFTDSVNALGTSYSVTTNFSGTITIGSGNQILSHDMTHRGTSSGPTSCAPQWREMNYRMDGNHLYVSYYPGVMVGGRTYYGSKVSKTLY